MPRKAAVLRGFFWPYKLQGQVSFLTAEKRRNFHLRAGTLTLGEESRKNRWDLETSKHWGNFWKILSQQNKTLGLEFSSKTVHMFLSLYLVTKRLRYSLIILPKTAYFTPSVILLYTFCRFIFLHKTTWLITYLTVYVYAVIQVYSWTASGL